jgi:uncharacterized caspase-like protein/opacity protein-like surface antigen
MALGLLLAVGISVLTDVVPAWAQGATPKRLAFVIGNGAYRSIPALQNALNDAGSTRSVLQEAGFEVVPASDATLGDLRGALDRFIERVRSAGTGATALVYYAGHAVQLDGTNYLLPVDVRPQRSSDIPAQALSLSDILRRLDGTGAVSKIVVLDACRNNPFAQAELSRGLALQLVDGAQDGIRSEAGLARIDSGSGTFVAFSTSPGATAADGTGANSPFTTAFLREIREPGLPIEQLFRRIRLSVHDATGGQQIPWDTSSLISDFAFFQRPAAVPGTTAPTAPATTQTPSLTLRPTAAALRSMAPAEAYRAAIAWDRRDLYRAALEAHPEDERSLRLHRSLALRTEETAWAETVRAGDAESFRLFARLYPGSGHVAEALRLAPAAPSRNRIQVAATCPVCPALAPRVRRADYTPRDVAPARSGPRLVATPAVARPAASPAAPPEGVEPLPPSPLPARPRWTGFYIGGSFGGAEQRSPTSIEGAGPTNSVQTSIAAGNVASRLSPSGGKATFTGQLGFNYQLGPMVLGAETDFSAMHVGGNKASTVNPFGVQVTTQAQTELFTLGTVRARAGFAFGDLMIFATGGYAYGHIGQRGMIAPVPTNNPTYVGTNPVMASGWTMGGGVEYALGPVIKLRLDYLHYDLGTQTVILGETAGFFANEYATMRAKTRGDTVRMGLNIGF